MLLKNTISTYGSVSKCLHWLIAISVILMLLAGLSFRYLPKGATFGTVMFLHKSLGVTLLGLIILRLLWRSINVVPALPINTPHWESILIRLVHYLFYAFVIVMPITGIVMTLAKNHPLSFWGITNINLSFIPKNEALGHFMAQWHLYFAWGLFGLIVLHTLAALKHHFVNKDDVLKRML